MGGRKLGLGVIALIGACFNESSMVGDGSTRGSDDETTQTGSSATATDGSGGDCDACPAGTSCVEGTCVPAGCGDGDGVVDEGQECDEGPHNSQSGGCKLDCTVQICGDNVVGPGETCDDGNLRGGDGCDAQCVLETCGNGRPDPGEECDDGNRVQGDGPRRHRDRLRGRHERDIYTRDLCGA